MRVHCNWSPDYSVWILRNCRNVTVWGTRLVSFTFRPHFDTSISCLLYTGPGRALSVTFKHWAFGSMTLHGQGNRQTNTNGIVQCLDCWQMLKPWKRRQINYISLKELRRGCMQRYPSGDECCVPLYFSATPYWILFTPITPLITLSSNPGIRRGLPATIQNTRQQRTEHPRDSKTSSPQQGDPSHRSLPKIKPHIFQPTWKYLQGGGRQISDVRLARHIFWVSTLKLEAISSSDIRRITLIMAVLLKSSSLKSLPITRLPDVTRWYQSQH